MGIRVNEISFMEQLEISDSKLNLNNDYHTKIINDELPQTIGGGIGISRCLMWWFNIPSITDVQESVFN